MLEREPPAAQPVGVDRTRRHRAEPAGPPRQQSQGSRITGHVPGDDLPQDPPVRDHHPGQLTGLDAFGTLSVSDTGIQVKTDASSGGLTQRVTYRDICMTNIKHLLIAGTTLVRDKIVLSRARRSTVRTGPAGGLTSERHWTR